MVTYKSITQQIQQLSLADQLRLIEWLVGQIKEKLLGYNLAGLFSAPEKQSAQNNNQRLQRLEGTSRPLMSVRQFREAGLIGLWQDRDDIQDSAVYARQLREKAQRRDGVDYDFLG